MDRHGVRPVHQQSVFSMALIPAWTSEKRWTRRGTVPAARNRKLMMSVGSIREVSINTSPSREPPDRGDAKIRQKRGGA